jgi:transposase
MGTATRKPYPTDVSDEEWAFVAPYLTLMTEDAPQRAHPLREVFNALRYLARSGACGVQKRGWDHAARRSYSWISPPRRSRRTTAPMAGPD